MPPIIKTAIETYKKAVDSDKLPKLVLFHEFNQEEFMRHYHARSNVESTFNMIKAKFGDGIKSKNWTAQQNELLAKVLCHNIVCGNPRNV